MVNLWLAASITLKPFQNQQFVILPLSQLKWTSAVGFMVPARLVNIVSIDDKGHGVGEFGKKVRLWCINADFQRKIVNGFQATYFFRLTACGRLKRDGACAATLPST